MSLCSFSESKPKILPKLAEFPNPVVFFFFFSFFVKHWSLDYGSSNMTII